MEYKVQTYIKKLQAGELQENERLQLIRWFEKLPQDESARFFEELGLQLEKLNEDEIIHMEKLLQEMQEARDVVPMQRRPSFPFLKIAAAILLLLVSGVVFYSYLRNTGDSSIQTTPQVAWKELKNPATIRSRVLLPDSSFVWLNAGSSLSYPEQFDDSIRQVKLVGEAYFEIKKDPSRPFIVSSQHFSTQVLGTTFNVKAFEGEALTVTVRSGKVKVFDDRTEKVLTRNEQVEIIPGTGVTEVKTVNAEEWASWRKGVLNLDNKTLEQAAREMERWYGVEIKIIHPQLKHCLIAGQHTNVSLNNVLESLAFVLGLEYTFEKGSVVITGGNCMQ